MPGLHAKEMSSAVYNGTTMGGSEVAARAAYMARSMQRHGEVKTGWEKAVQEGSAAGGDAWSLQRDEET